MKIKIHENPNQDSPIHMTCEGDHIGIEFPLDNENTLGFCGKIWVGIEHSIYIQEDCILIEI